MWRRGKCKQERRRKQLLKVKREITEMELTVNRRDRGNTNRRTLKDRQTGTYKGDGIDREQKRQNTQRQTIDRNRQLQTSRVKRLFFLSGIDTVEIDLSRVTSGTEKPTVRRKADRPCVHC